MSEDEMEKQQRKDRKRQQRKEDFEKVKQVQKDMMVGGQYGSKLT